MTNNNPNLVRVLVFQGVVSSESQETPINKDKEIRRVPFGTINPQQIKVDQKVLMLLPHVPVVGRLQYFHENWEKITGDKWVLSTIRNSLLLDFMQIPEFKGMRQTRAPSPLTN